MNCPHCNVPNPDEARFCAACGRATSMTEPSFTGMKAVPDLLGKEIAGRYRVTAKLGEGGMGAVYKAEQISLKRQCAIKLLRPEVAGASIMLQRFNAEAQSVARLSHPNTVGIYDFGQDTDGSFFIAMEFVEGKSLREAIQTESPFPIRRALAIASQVAASLTDAHSHAIVHRDLKPDNVMLQQRGKQKDVARVLDFGIAKLRDEGRATQQAMTQAGDMLGTPQYMAPEQIRGEQIDGRTDIYALGCMIYEMVTGRMPFEGPTVMALLSKHLMETPPPPSQRRPDLQIPPFIDQLVMTAIAKDRNGRPPTMEAFGEQINALLSQFPSESGQGTAQVSAQVGAVGPTMATGGGPGSYAGGFAPHTPPPAGGFAPNTPAPGGYPTPGVAAAPAMTPMAMQPYGAGPPQQYAAAPQQPYPLSGPPGMTSTPAAGNSKMILIIVAVLVVIGGGIGVVFALKGGGGGDTKPADAQQEAAADAAEKPDKVVDAEAPAKKIDAKVKVEDDDDGDDTPDEPETGSDDPWSGGAADKADDATMAKELVTATEKLRKDMCACTDIQCASKVGGQNAKFAQVMAKYAARLARLDAASLAKMTANQQEMAQCASRIATGIAPKPKPKGNLNTELDAFVNAACGCIDEACGRRALDALVAWGKRNKNRNDGDEEKAKQSLLKMVACLKHDGLEEKEILEKVSRLGS